MTFYDSTLYQLQEQVLRSRQLKSILAELRTQRETLRGSLHKLEAVLLEEEQDVQKLEGRSLSAFFYNVIGRMDEKLDNERREAYAARVKYDGARNQLRKVEQDIADCERELQSLADAEAMYKMGIEERLAELRSGSSIQAREIVSLEANLAHLRQQKTEVWEAMDAGNTALDIAREILEELDDAEGFSTWDILGGGLLVDLAKHEHLDQAQAKVEQLQTQLRSFQTELADVELADDLQVQVGGFLQFADFFFDGLFADWSVREEIHTSQNQVRQTIGQLTDVVTRLRRQADQIAEDEQRLRARLDSRVLGN